MEKPIIKEWIVVEGKDDVAAVKKAVHAHVIATSGLGIQEKTLALIEKGVEHPGIIVLTDPDFPGEKIRRIINERVPGCKHAYLPKAEGLKRGNVGVENASPEAIRSALDKVKVQGVVREQLDQMDLLLLGMLHGNGAKERRRAVGEALGIGYANAKQFVQRINSYGITREDLLRTFDHILEELERKTE